MKHTRRACIVCDAPIQIKKRSAYKKDYIFECSKCKKEYKPGDKIRFLPISTESYNKDIPIYHPTYEDRVIEAVKQNPGLLTSQITEVLKETIKRPPTRGKISNILKSHPKIEVRKKRVNSNYLNTFYYIGE